MKQFYLPLVLFFSLLISQFSWSQVKVGDNPTQISPFTVFELESTDKGFLPPRLTTTQRNGIDKQTAPLGLMIYNLDRNEVQYLNEEISIDATGKRLVVRTWESATSGASLTRPDAPEAGELYFDPDTGSLEVWNGSQWLSVSLGATTSSPTLLIDGSMLTIVGGNTVDLSTIIGQSGPRGGTGATGPAGPPGPAGPTGGDNQTLTLSGTTLSIQNGNSVDLTVFTNTDSQTITASLSGTILQLLPENTTLTETLDLAYFNNTGTDDQNLSFATSTSTTEGELVIESGNPVTLITSGTLSLVNTNSSTLTLVSTATHGQLIQVNEGGKTGYRLLAADPSNHGDTGTNAVDLSTQTAASSTTGATGDYSFAVGRNTTASGEHSTAEGWQSIASGTYARAMDRTTSATTDFATASGYQTTASGEHAIALGNATTASGQYSTAEGWGSVASGTYARAMGRTISATAIYATASGYESIASGEYSTAEGWRSNASGNHATASGAGSFAQGDYAMARGESTTAESYGQTTLGFFSTPHPAGANASGIVATDRLFVIGNGTALANRSDALVVLKNGATTLNGPLTINVSSTTFSYTLTVQGGANNQILTMQDANTGTTTWTTLVTPTHLVDADGNTSVTVERTADVNQISFTVSSTEHFLMNGARLEVLNSRNSVFVGAGAGANDDLNNNKNVFVGQDAGNNNTRGVENVAIGPSALSSNTITHKNVAIGVGALSSNITGNQGVAIGAHSQENVNAIGINNTSVGYQSLFGSANTASNTGAENTALGGATLRGNTSGSNNTAVGYGALYSNTTGSNNIAIGYDSGFNITTGSNNTIIGSGVYGSATLSNTVIIADGSANQRIYVNNLGHTGLNTTAPTAELDVNGTARLRTLPTGVTTDVLVVADTSGNLRQLPITRAGTDTQTLSLTGDTLSISGTNSVSLDDFSQDITGSNFDSMTNSLTIAISNGASETISLATLGNTTVSGTLIVNTAIGIGINPNTASYTLDIVGDANITGEIYRTGTVTFTHPDYVFESYFDGISEFNTTYRLPSLEEVERFVRVNKHLPGVQSRTDIQNSGRWNVSKNIQSNLEKVEELYLHTIEQQKQLDAKDAEIKALKERLAKIEAALGI